MENLLKERAAIKEQISGIHLDMKGASKLYCELSEKLLIVEFKIKQLRKGIK